MEKPHQVNTVESSLEFTCPICRAKQTVRSQCRRCSADLDLYAKAILSLRFASDQDRFSALEAPPNGMNANTYLQWLKPGK